MFDIVFLIDQLGPGGAETQLVRTATTLARRGWQVGILSLFKGNNFQEELRAAGLPLLVYAPGIFPAQHPRHPPLKMVWWLVRQLRNARPSALITFSYHSDILGRICGRLAGVPTIIGSLRTAYAKNSLREKVYRYTEPLIDLTISNSWAGIDYMVSRRVLSPEKTRVIPNGLCTSDYPSPIPREEVRADLGIGPEDFLWLAVGSLAPAKDYPTLIEAAARCVAEAPAFRLCVAGGGPLLDPMREMVRSRGLEGTVRFLGSRPDVGRLLKAADAYVLSSAWEGLPNAVMEALASGLPVVATDVGGVRELVEPGRSGWIVPARDPVALSTQMLAVMALDAAARREAGTAGRRHMVTSFDRERVADAWEEQLLLSAPALRKHRPNDPPAFVISIDFELLWGMRDKHSIATYGDHILGEREAIPSMLRLFRQYGVKATWAAVGLTLFDRRDDLLKHLPDRLPTYADRNLDPYCRLDEIGDDERSDPYHYGLSLVRRILDCEGMELGSHTFSHFYCLARGQTADQFRADLEASVAATERLAARPVSFVFPRNQYNPEYLSVCARAGFTCFRGNERAWVYRGGVPEHQSLYKRGVRLLDHYVNLTGPNSFLPTSQVGLINCPSSRFLRPRHPLLGPLEPRRMARIRNAMEAAARAGECFHLWWHPHNLGTHLQENLANVEELLRFHVALRDRYGVVPATMGEIAERARAARRQEVRPPLLNLAVE